MDPIACWVQTYAEVRFVLSTASQSARFIRMMSWSRVMPALLIRISILPSSEIMLLKVAFI